MGTKQTRAWRITVSAVLSAIAVAIAQKKLMPCIDVVQTGFGIDKSAAGLLSSVFCIMGLAMAIPAAYIVKRVGERKTCLYSLGCAAAGSVLGLFARSYGLLLLSRIIEGIGAGLISVAVPQIIALCFPPEKRGLPTGLWSSWQFVASAVCFLFVSQVASRSGWRGAWVFSLVITFAALGLCLLFTRPPEDAAAQGSQQREPFPLRSFLKALNNANAWLLSACMFCYCFCYLAHTTWLASFWNEQAGIELVKANRLISYSSILAIPVTLLAGAMLDRADRKRVCFLGSLAYAVCMALGFSLRSYGWILALVILKPFAEGIVSTALWTMIPLSARGSEEKTWVIALFTLLSNLAMLVSSPLTGAMITGMGWSGCGAVLIGISVLGAVLVALVRLPQSRRTYLK
ncbi:MAG: MFS transporter [Clostridia bacterium]|nr:MFS transporter [Clostridia bacterium]